MRILGYLGFVPGVWLIFCLCTIPKHEHAKLSIFLIWICELFGRFPESPRFRGSKNRHSEVTTPLPVKADTPTMLLVTKAHIFSKTYPSEEITGRPFFRR